MSNAEWIAEVNRQGGIDAGQNPQKGKHSLHGRHRNHNDLKRDPLQPHQNGVEPAPQAAPLSGYGKHGGDRPFFAVPEPAAADMPEPVRYKRHGQVIQQQPVENDQPVAHYKGRHNLAAIVQGWKRNSQLWYSEDSQGHVIAKPGRPKAAGTYQQHCAFAVNGPLRQNGFSVYGDAANLLESYKANGFKIQPHEGYIPHAGDVAITRYADGHIAGFDGKRWHSDTDQIKASPYSAAPASATLYLRHPDLNAQALQMGNDHFADARPAKESTRPHSGHKAAGKNNRGGTRYAAADKHLHPSRHVAEGHKGRLATRFSRSVPGLS